MLIFWAQPDQCSIHSAIHHSNHPPMPMPPCLVWLVSNLSPPRTPWLDRPLCDSWCFLRPNRPIAPLRSRLTMFTFYSFNSILLPPHVTFIHKSCCSNLGSGDICEPNFLPISMYLHALILPMLVCIECLHVSCASH